MVFDLRDTGGRQNLRAIDTGIVGHIGDAAFDAAASARRVRQSILFRVHGRLFVAVAHPRRVRCAWEEADCIPAVTIRFLRSPPVTTTQPTCRRSQLERDAIKAAVAMKYSSQDGRCGKAAVACITRSTGSDAEFMPLS